MIVKGKTEEALKICKNVARVNGKEISEEELHLEDFKVDQRLGDIPDLFRSRSLAKNTLIMWYCW